MIYHCYCVNLQPATEKSIAVVFSLLRFPQPHYFNKTTLTERGGVVWVLGGGGDPGPIDGDWVASKITWLLLLRSTFLNSSYVHNVKCKHCKAVLFRAHLFLFHLRQQQQTVTTTATTTAAATIATPTLTASRMLEKASLHWVHHIYKIMHTYVDHGSFKSVVFFFSYY